MPTKKSTTKKASQKRKRLYQTEASEPQPDIDNTSKQSGATTMDDYDIPLRPIAMMAVDHYMKRAATAGLVPIPVVDIFVIGVTNMKMVKSLAEIYELSFCPQEAKTAIAGLVTGSFSSLLAASLIKSAPGLGYIGVAVPMIAANAAVTYAIGTTFMKHFEAGGSLFNFQPEKMSSTFSKALAEKST